LARQSEAERVRFQGRRVTKVGPRKSNTFRARNPKKLAKKLANEKLEAAEMNEDASMNCGMWDEWGAVGG
jgi:hypothetical protein